MINNTKDSLYTPKSWHLLVLVSIAFMLIIVLVYVSFSSSKKLLSSLTSDHIEQIINNSQLVRNIGEINAEITLFQQKYINQKSYTKTQSNSLIQKINSLHKAAVNPGLKQLLHDLSTGMLDYKTRSLEVNKLLIKRNSWHSKSFDLVNNLEEEISDLMIKETLEGHDISFIEQILSLVSIYKEDLHKIERFNMHQSIRYLDSFYNQIIGQKILDQLDHLYLRLQTITASSRVIAEHGNLISLQVLQYKGLASALNNSLNLHRESFIKISHILEKIIKTTLQIEMLMINDAENAALSIESTVELSRNYLLIISTLIMLVSGMLIIILHRKEQRKIGEMRLANLVIENSSVVAFRWKLAEGWPVDYVSNNVTQFGYSVEELLSGKIPYINLIHPEDRERVSKEVVHHSSIETEDSFFQEYRIISPAGKIFWVDDRTTIEKDAKGNILFYQGVLLDNTDRKQLEEKLKHQSNHDYLTGLYNRRRLYELLKVDLMRANRYQHPLSLFMIDIDHFKYVNDQYGHNTGDQVLKKVAYLLKTSVREIDYPSRYGGEEFVVVLPETATEKALNLAERLRIIFHESTFETENGNKLKISVSIGVSSAFMKDDTIEDLINRADIALYNAKAEGRNRVILSKDVDLTNL